MLSSIIGGQTFIFNKVTLQSVENSKKKFVTKKQKEKFEVEVVNHPPKNNAFDENTNTTLRSRLFKFKIPNKIKKLPKKLLNPIKKPTFSGGEDRVIFNQTRLKKNPCFISKTTHRASQKYDF